MTSARPAWIFLLAVTAMPSRAAAGVPLFRCEQVDFSECDSGLVTVHFMDLARHGEVKTFSADTYMISVDGEFIGAPLRETTFARTRLLLGVSIVLQADAVYEKDLPLIRQLVRSLLEIIPARAIVGGVAFGGSIIRLGKQVSPEVLARRLGDLAESSAPAGTGLLEAVRIGLDDLGEMPQGARRISIVIADGIDEKEGREEIQRLGRRASAEDIQIMPIAYSPADDRPRLKALGELAKLSHGTFRWAERAAMLPDKIHDLGIEIAERPALTFRAPRACRGPHAIRLQDHTELSTVCSASHAATRPIGEIVLLPLAFTGAAAALAGALLIIRRRRAITPDRARRAAGR